MTNDDLDFEFIQLHGLQCYSFLPSVFLLFSDGAVRTHIQNLEQAKFEIT